MHPPEMTIFLCKTHFLGGFSDVETQIFALSYLFSDRIFL